MNKKNHASSVVALTGGHFSPAYALAGAFIQEHIPVIFFGRTDAFTEGQSPTIEHKLIGSLPGVTFIPIKGVRLNKFQPVNFISSVVATWKELLRKRVSYIVSFGGYLAVPVCIAGWLLRIPIYLHEQTVAPGRANRFLARLACLIFVSFPQAQRYFPSHKTHLLGNPYHADFFLPQKPDWFTREQQKPLLVVMGGSSGAHIINMTLFTLLAVLTRTYQVVHQTGANRYHDYEQALSRRSSSYYPVKNLLPREIAYLLGTADLAVTRSGANTFFLLVHYRLPAVLIPLAIAPNDEQRKHAQLIADNAAGVIVQETDLGTLAEAIAAVDMKKNTFRRNFSALDPYNKLIVSGSTLLTAITNHYAHHRT